MTGKRVAVAMSGGVDSSIAAALLKQAGHEVSGVHMELWPGAKGEQTTTDLEHTCQILDIPLRKLDLEADFNKSVVDYFCREYSRGRTPNPCIACNRYIKFDLLLDKVLQMGADYLATGHYARIERSRDGYRLRKGADPAKDQSYFLYTLGQKELQHLLFPLGNRHKAEVRELAARLGLPVSDQRDSQDVCFVPDNDYRSFLANRIPAIPGNIVNAEGTVLGRHNGLSQYTVGQRQGLGLAAKKRLYVINVDTAGNRLVVGGEEQLSIDTIRVSQVNWVEGKSPSEPVRITAKIRYQSPEVKATLYPDNGLVELRFDEPQRALAPGQAVVFHRGDTIFGGGIIEEWQLDTL